MIEALSWAEIGAVAFSFAYVILAAREKVWCWPVGIIGCIFWFYAAWFEYKLKIDALLQLYYVGISLYGWYAWQATTEDNRSVKIHTLPFSKHVSILVGGSITSVVCGYFFSNYTDAVATYPDAFTTVFSIITTALVTRKILENWIYWVVIDIGYIALYGSRGGYLFAGLFVAYTIIAVVGYFQWKRSFDTQKSFA